MDGEDNVTQGPTGPGTNLAAVSKELERRRLLAQAQRMQQQVGKLPLDPETYLAQRGGSLKEGIGVPGDLRREARATATAAGVLEGALLGPARAVLRFPGDVARFMADDPGKSLITDEWANKVAELDAGIATNVERAAKQTGASNQEIASAKTAGKFIGFTLPIVGAFSATKLAIDLPIVTDVVAGSIYGGLMNPDAKTLGDRFHNAFWEGGMFGAWAAALRAPIWALNNIALRNQWAQGKIKSVEELIQLSGGEGIVQTPEQAKSLFDMLSHQEYLINSPQVVDILRAQTDESAIASAIISAAGARANAGVIPGLAGPFERIAQLEDQFKTQFPHLKIQSVKMNDGSFSMYFGTKGLNKAQITQLKLEGRYLGQRVMYRGQEVSYVVKGKDNKVAIKDLTTGKIKFVKAKNISPLFHIAEPAERAPAYDALYQDFQKWFGEKITAAAEGQAGVDVDTIRKAIAEGRITPQGYRQYVADGALVQEPPKPYWSPMAVEHIEQDPMKILDHNYIRTLIDFVETATPADSKGVIDRLRVAASKADPALSADFEVAIGKLELAASSKFYDTPLSPMPPAAFEDLVLQWAGERGIINDKMIGTRVVNPDGTPKMVFHGTANTFEQFDKSKFRPGLYGEGVYLTEDPGIASSYSKAETYARRVKAYEDDIAHFNRQLEMVRSGDREAINQIDYIHRFTRQWQSGGGAIDEIEAGLKWLIEGRTRAITDVIAQEAPQVRPVNARIKNPFDTEAPVSNEVATKIWNVVAKYYPQYAADWANEFHSFGRMSEDRILAGLFQDRPASPHSGESLYRFLEEAIHGPITVEESIPVNRMLEEAGFDGVTHIGGRMSGGKAHRVWIAFHPEQVETAFAPKPNIPTDFQTFKTHFAQRMREYLWSLAPAEDKAAYEAVKAEYDKLVADSEPTLKEYAANLGFHTETDGQHIILRDINSGASWTFNTEIAAREALAKTVRPGGFSGGELPPNFGDTAVGGHGLPNPDGEWFFPDDNLTEAFARRLPTGLRKGPTFSNRYSWAERVEEITGIPIWTNGLSKIDRGISLSKDNQYPWAKQVDDKVTKLLPATERRKVFTFMQTIERMAEERGKPIDAVEKATVAKSMGLSSKHVLVANNIRDLLDKLGVLFNIPKDKWVIDYISRMQPYNEAHGGMLDPERVAAGLAAGDPWWTHARTGELSIVEQDPSIILHKYISTGFWDKYVRDPWEQLARLTYINAGGEVRGVLGGRPLLIKDLPLERQQAMQAAFPEAFNPNAPALHPAVNKILSEYLTIVRGHPTASFETARRYFSTLLDKVGIQADPRTLDEMISMYMSVQYGAAMGLRSALIARNFTQNLWNLYVRLGGKYGGESLRAALDIKWYNEAIEAGALRIMDAGVPMGDVITEHIMESVPRGEGAIGIPVAAGLRALLRAGELGRRAAQKTLIPYANSDEVNRVWAYAWQKMHTNSWLEKFEAGKISEATFNEKGLPFYSQVKRAEFMKRLKYFGREDALRFIGKEAADEANFIYGIGAQPSMMQGPFGRFFGMFGTYPLWAKEIILNKWAYGTLSQKSAMSLRYATVGTAIGMIGAYAGVNMWNWISPLSIFSWAGGPMVDQVIDAHQIVTAPMDQKWSAARRLGQHMAGLTYPGQAFLHDIVKANEATEDPGLQVLLVLLGHPTKESMAMKYLFDPSLPFTPQQDPDRAAWLKAQNGVVPETYTQPALSIPQPSLGGPNWRARSAAGGTSGVDIGSVLGGNTTTSQ